MILSWLRLYLLKLLLSYNPVVGILVELIQFLHQELWWDRRLLVIGLLLGVLLFGDSDLLPILSNLVNLLDLIGCLPLLELFLGHLLDILLLLIFQLGILIIAYLVELLHKLHVMVISRHGCLLLILLVLDLFVDNLLLSLLLELWLLELLLSLSVCVIGHLLLMVGGFVNTGILIGSNVLRLDLGNLLLELATLQLLLMLEKHLILLLLCLLLLDMLLLLLLRVGNQGRRLLSSETGLLLVLLLLNSIDLWLRALGWEVLSSILDLLLVAMIHHLLKLHLVGELLLADDWRLVLLLLLLLL